MICEPEVDAPSKTYTTEDVDAKYVFLMVVGII